MARKIGEEGIEGEEYVDSDERVDDKMDEISSNTSGGDMSRWEGIVLPRLITAFLRIGPQQMQIIT